MRPFFNALAKIPDLELHTDEVHRRIYSVDASIYEVEPLAIIKPKTEEALIEAVKVAYQFKVPTIPRGAATGITGGCIGKGLIIDLSKYLNKITKIDKKKQCVYCQPGVVQNSLNATLAPHGFRLGPNTSTGNRATVGGMLANNAAGAHSLRFGQMVDHILECDLLLADGTVITLGPLTESQWSRKAAKKNREGEIYKALTTIREEHCRAIEMHTPQMPRQVSGYNLNRLLTSTPLNPAQLIAGSEGTLGIVTKMKLQLSPILKQRGICLAYFDNLVTGFEVANTLQELPLISLEMIDDKIITAGKQSPALRDRTDWLTTIPKMLLIAEVEADDENQAAQKARYVESFLAKETPTPGYTQVLTAPEEVNSLWALRESGLGLLLSKRTYSRAIAFIEDIAVPPAQLPSFIKKFVSYLQSVKKEAGIYGHVGSGCLHIRPYINLNHESERKLMKKIMEDVSSLILEEHGSMSGEHGDGLVRSWLNKKMFGEEVYGAFVKVKEAFDPDYLMNPNKIVNGSPFLQDLRQGPNNESLQLEPYLDFSAEGGFELAVDMCNGNGQCRKKEGLMCPSFQATQDEFDSTRARAQALRSIINGKMSPESIASEEVQKVLDLCLECKGCKSECPSQVDIAKVKSELLFQYQEKHGYSFRNRLFANMPRFFKIASLFAPIVNWMTKQDIFRWQQPKLGITAERTLPALASQRFSHWFSHHPQMKSEKKVVLYSDSYTEFIEPQIGKDAVKILQALGYEVIVPSWSCCGKPLISKGFLKQAKEQAGKTVKALSAYGDFPIIGLEPSCLLSLKDDYPSLGLQIKGLTTFDEFLAEQDLTPLKETVKGIVALHGHCHQKSLIGMAPTLKVLNELPHVKVSEIPSGCCGMAGSFGYEDEHYDLSMKIGNLVLFPAVKALPKGATVVATGFSCRCQIHSGTEKKALHLASFLALFYK